MSGKCKREGWGNGFNGQFKKGHVPVNKGTKGMFNVGGNRTSFKKGQKPINYRPVGSERVSRDGYIEIKVKDPNVWKLKHRVVWEEAYGKIPKGMQIMFIDQNPTNVNIENLVLVSKAQNALLNKNRMLTDNKELNELSINYAKVVTKINEIEKEGGAKRWDCKARLKLI